MIEKARWYWDRLRAMSPAEMSGRGQLAWQKQAWRRRRRWVAPRPELRPVDTWVLPAGFSADAELLAEAQRTLDGEYRLLNLSYREPNLDWHLDPQTGRRPPLAFGPDLDYRDIAVAGNVKNTWEKNRHTHLTVLALAFATTRQPHYALEVERQLRSWVRANPFPRGVNWNSCLELGIRLIAWVWIERLLRGSQVHAGLFGEAGLLWEPIYWHQWLIARHPAHGSSANNHLVGEAAGAYLAATVWPYFEASAGWREAAQQVLEREIVLQTFPGGLNREQALAYHLFSLELFLLPGIEGDRLATPFSATYKERLAAQLGVLPGLTDVAGNLPRYGDEDGGLGVQLRAQSHSRLAWLYGIGRTYLGLPLPAGSENVLDCPECPIAPASTDITDAGLHLLATAQGTPHELFCLVDAGPLGYLSIAGHGHADALSFTLSAGGHPVIIDPGTYSYHAEPHWRAYFRGTRAHNTVLLDDEDQSVARGPFLWSRQQAETTVLESAENRLIAAHDGYMRLPGHPVHQRELHLQNQTLTVRDAVQGSGTHALEWRLHFAPHCDLTLSGSQLLVTWPGGRLALACDPRLSWRLACGEDAAGWYSPGFNLKTSTCTLIGSAVVALPFSLAHHLEVSYAQN